MNSLLKKLLGIAILATVFLIIFSNSRKNIVVGSPYYRSIQPLKSNGLSGHASNQHPSKNGYRLLTTSIPLSKSKSFSLMQRNRPALLGATNNSLVCYLAKEIKGEIGLFGDKQLDNPSDNLFIVQLDCTPTSNDRAWIVYDLEGLDDQSNVPFSINDRLAKGGNLIKKSQKKSKQRVEIAAEWLHKGANSFLFGVQEGIETGYCVSNLSVEIAKGAGELPLVVISGNSMYGNKAYVRGFVRTQQGRNPKVIVGDQNVSLNDGEFEAMISHTDSVPLSVIADYGKGIMYEKRIAMQSKSPADYTFALSPKAKKETGQLLAGKVDRMRLEENEIMVDSQSLKQNLSLSMGTLRSVDMPSLDLGMTNVTASSQGIRFLPHGNHFEGKGATVALAYDRTKIPTGYTENDIKTYYFDTQSRHWVALERDSIDRESQRVVSKTTHFTDMINGVIKAPESPETQGFTPTMMNDIKAADPTSKITMIAPPTANNQGSANLTYNLELPPARNGMSPQLAIHYNSDGGSGWLGEGWDLNVPNIAVDTRWGVPRYDPNYETETYVMGGAMLATVIAPKASRDSLGNPSVSHRGVLYERDKEIQPPYNCPVKEFHPIVENGFSKIRRFQFQKEDYYWVVTDNKGVNYLYGASTESHATDQFMSKPEDIIGGYVSTFQYKSDPAEGKEPISSRWKQAEWKLSEVVDLHGFYNKYFYDSVDNDTIAGEVTSKTKILTQIQVGQRGYNGDGDTIFYTVKFVTRTPKAKRTNNGRYGFLVSGQNRLLDSILIYTHAPNTKNTTQGTILLKAYSFSYKKAPFNTELLEKVTQLDADKEIVSSHKMEYYDNFLDLSAKELYRTPTSLYPLTSLGSGQSNSSGGSGYVGVGVGISAAVSGEIGYQHTFGSSKSQRNIIIIDINGDGLPDKLFKPSAFDRSGLNNLGGHLYFMPNLGLGSFGPPILINGAPENFSVTESKSHSNGWQGDVNIARSSVNAGMDWSKTYTKTTTYLSDVNNDGLVDIIDDGRVYFNYVNYINGIAVPSFSASSLRTQNPIANIKTIIGKSVPLKSEDPIKRAIVYLTREQLSLIERTPLQDVVKVWEAPFDGLINITGTVKLLDIEGLSSDGVMLRIQVEGDNRGEDWKYPITMKNRPRDISIPNSIEIKAGQRVFFRLQGGTGVLSDDKGDVVELKPKIEYTTSSHEEFNENGYSSRVYLPSDAHLVNKLGYNLVDTIPTTRNMILIEQSDFKVIVIEPRSYDSQEGRYRDQQEEEVWYYWTDTVWENKPILKLKGTFTKPVTSGDITLDMYISNDSCTLVDSIVENKTDSGTSRVVYRVQRVNKAYQAKKLIWSRAFRAGDSFVNLPIEADLSAIPNSTTQCWFGISSNVNVRWGDVVWKPELHYRTLTNKDTVVYAGVKYNMYSKRLKTGGWLEYDGGKTICDHTWHKYNCQTDLSFKDNRVLSNIDCTFELRDQDNGLLLRREAKIVNNQIRFNSEEFYFKYLSGRKFKQYLFINDTMSVEPEINHNFRLWQVNSCGFWFESYINDYLGFDQVNVFCKRTNKQMELGPMFRGWGQFEYNCSTVDRFRNKIQTDSLRMPKSKADMDSLRNLTMYHLNPDPIKKNKWRGLTGQIFVDGDIISTGRNNIELQPNLETWSGSHSFSARASALEERAEEINESTTNESLLFKENRLVLDETQNSFVLPTEEERAEEIDESTTNELLFFKEKRLVLDETKNSFVLPVEENSTVNQEIENLNDESLYENTTAPVLSTTSESVSSWGGASTSIGSVSLGASGNNSKGSSKTTMAFMDLNGDGYPDYITDNQIEYSNPRGARDGEVGHLDQETTLNNSWSVGINGAYSSSKSPNSSENKMQTMAEICKDLLKNPAASISVGGAYSENKDYATNAYVDVNGDGLPDRITEEALALGQKTYKVSLNLGYRFSPPMDYGINHIQGGKTVSKSVSLGLNVNAGFVAGGVTTNHTWTSSLTLFALRDMNGDGLVDQLLIDDDGKCSISYNKGNTFTGPIENDSIRFINESYSDGNGNNTNFKATIPILPFVKITIGGSVNLGTSSDYIKSEIQDINGDGYPDLLSLDKNNNVLVKHSTIGYTNKLKSVTNPFGGQFSLEYDRSKSTNKHPGGKWVLSAVEVNDGIADDGTSKRDSFMYSGGKYDRYEREFLGFAELNTYNIDTQIDKKAIFRTIKQTFDTTNCFTKGNLLRSTVLLGDGSSGKVLSTSSNEYQNYSFSRYIVKSAKYGKNKLTKINTPTFNEILRKQFILYSPIKYNQTKQTGLDGSNAQKTSSYFDYNTGAGTKGELLTYKFSKNGTLLSDGTGDYDYSTETEYLNIYSLPVKHTVKSGKENKPVVRQLLADWDILYSNHLLKLKVLTSANDTSITDFKYDRWGNILRKTLPQNSNGERMAYSYTYDKWYNMYPFTITDSHGYTSRLEDYDYRFGIPRRTVDINGNVMTTTLDNLGRVVQIKGPNDPLYTLKFKYPTAVNGSSGITFPAYAVTKHYDPTHPDNDLETVTFVDGLGRPIQVKKEGVVGTDSAMIVSGRAKYDAFGRVVEAYYPTTEPMSSKLVFNTSFDGTAPTKTEYDALDRPTKVTLPNGTSSTTAYDIVNGLLRTTATDALGHSQESFTSGTGKTVRTVQYHNNTPIVTAFEYDGIDQLKTVTDAKGGITESTYDMAGRRTKVVHPASGETSFRYDNAGNLIEKLTASLKGKQSPIRYRYTYNRLDSILYPEHPENNVVYTYGDNSATDNRKGRLMLQQDGSGAQEFWYGRMGELTQVRRTLVIPNQAVASYTTQWSYDSWNRIQTMTYPDGEQLRYNYNTGGQLTGVTGSKGSESYPYVSSILYDKFEQRTRLTYGNGTATDYIYDPTTRRLGNLKVMKNDNYLINNAYTYDDVSNVTDVINSAGPLTFPNSTNTIGGGMVHHYDYDDLYRLKKANGVFTGSNGKKATYSLEMGYDELYNITRKSQHITQNNVQFEGYLQAGYDLGYSYANNPQQISNIADTSYREAGLVRTPEIKQQQFSYDANGNLLSINSGEKRDGKLQAANSRKLLWDEENRLLALSDNGFVSNYWYDAAGERTVKMSGENEEVLVNGRLLAGRLTTNNFTAYISPYLVVRNGGEYTKHIYIGSQRITSKVANSGIFSATPVTTTDQQAKYAELTAKIRVRFDSLGVTYSGRPQTGGLVSNSPTESSASYFYHSDHLGSSSLITDVDGNLAQHLEYIPYGEVFIDERNGTWSTPYRFNGKEQDEETGLCYYGARYYDPRTSVWLSVDPLAEKYVGRSSYEFTGSNPVKYIDPDGRDWYRHDKSGAIFWQKGNANTVARNDQTYRNIGKAYSSYSHGVRVDYNQNQITKVTEVSPRFNKEGGEYIPKTFTTDDGTKVKVTFNYSSSTGGNGDKALSKDAVSLLITGVNEANNSGASITSVDVSTTTTGKHSSTSNHYVSNGASAFDIDMVNGVSVRNSSSHEQVDAIQNGMMQNPNLRENYGPNIQEKSGKKISISGHNNHIHASTKRR